MGESGTVGCLSEGSLTHSGLSMPVVDIVHANPTLRNWVQTGCVVAVLAPVVRLPNSRVYALWP